ncbi:MAG: TRAP transporter small permease [Burkholderiaceae bacterium]|nr:TRAP transporter small permease [Burkholderiaceae bacterium]
MMLLTVADVAGRHVLGRPLPGAVELVQYAMVIVVFAGLPVVTRDGRHISLGVLAGWLSPSWQHAQRRVVGLVCAVILSAQAWIVFETAQVMRAQQDVIGFLNLPVHPAAYAISLLSMLAAVAVLLHSMADARSPALGDEAPS